jgi:hypothetical protein
MSSSIDLNINNYTQEDLLELFDLNSQDDVSYDDIINASSPLINRYTSEDNYDYANFFQQAQNKLLEDLDYDSDNDDSNLQNNQDSQIGNLYSNEYPSQQQTDPNQANKVTDRTQQVSIFNQNDNYVMNKNQLGVSNTFQVPVAQGQLNPNLKNTNTRLINIDSQYRENIIPFDPNPDGVSSPTNYTLDLTDILNNTISLEVTAFQIPYTWYLIDASYQANNCFFVDNSMISIPSGNYSNTEIINFISIQLTSEVPDLDISYNSNSGKTFFTNSSSTSSYQITFFDPSGILTCNSSCGITSKFNNNLGWILGFRGNVNYPPSQAATNPLYGQLVYNISSKGVLTSEAFLDTFGSKYFLLILDDFNQNHLNKGLVGITPTQKYAEIPSYWNTNLQIAQECSTPTFNHTKKPSYVQNAPRKLTQAQLYTLNQTTQARTSTNKNMLTSPTTTDVLALIPLRLANNLSPGQQIIDDFNLDEAKRVYFGPVDIERMRVRLVNDKGYTVNLNGNDWSFTLTATTLYQY